MWDFTSARVAATKSGDGNPAPFVAPLAEQFRRPARSLLILDEVPEADRSQETLRSRRTSSSSATAFPVAAS